MPSSSSKMVIGKAKEPLLLKTIWDSLPKEFEAKDFKAVAKAVELTFPTAEHHIR